MERNDMKNETEKTEAEKLRDSLLAACKAAGIDEPRYVAQDGDGEVFEYMEKPFARTGIDLDLWDDYSGVYKSINHPPYADDWRESLLDFVPQENIAEESSPSGIEALVCADIAARQRVGIKKYGTTLGDNPLTTLQTLQHAYEESLDFPIYLKKLIVDMSKKPTNETK
jgi:hypothetical protein